MALIIFVAIFRSNV